ncbi:paraquat-inducible protein A [Chromobacterium sp. ATCC 53434]|nr:paraquat-inducible protein A [Chromobacterium sp. ATCC 53434]
MGLRVVACHECDLPLRLPADGRLCCPRCGHVLRQGGDARALPALLIACIPVFLVANAWPVITLEAAGQRVSVTLWQTALALEANDMHGLAALVLLTGVLLPALELACLLSIAWPALWRRKPRGLGLALRLQALLRPWRMIEVFFLAILVALVKLRHLADVKTEPGLWALLALMLLLAAVAGRFDGEDAWARLERME